MELIEFNGVTYPALQGHGFASQFAFSFASKFLKGTGYDIGCNRVEWCYPGAIPIDPVIDDRFDAFSLPEGEVDYIFSSHALEHIFARLGDVIQYWLTKIKKGGIIFLYLPNCDYQKYWAWGNKKHVHYLSPSIMNDLLSHTEVKDFIVTDGYDLNGSFYCIIEK